MSETVEPFRIGYLDEGLMPDAATFRERIADVIQFRFDEASEAGEVDRAIELVVGSGQGLPYGTAKAVRDAWLGLAEQGVLAIIGPGIADNCMAVVPLFESHRVPTINFPGTTRSRGRYGFHYQLGSLYDDGPLIARAVERAGLADVAVIRDRSPIGVEFFESFEEECQRCGVSISRDVKCSPVAGDLGAEVDTLVRAEPDALVYLGFGGVLLDLSRSLSATGWDPPRFTTSAGMHFYSKGPDERREMSGWVYVDQVDEENDAMQGMLDRYERRSGTRPFDPLTGAMYDMATLAVLGLRHATVHTPEGVMEGLERIHQVPAVLGGAGTVLGFGPWERTALKGPNYLVQRQMSGVESVKYQL